MTGSATDHDKFWMVQGDRVLVNRHGGEQIVLTLVHAVDIGGHQLRLVNRDTSDRQPDWAVSQKLFDAIKPATPEMLALGIKWWLAVK